MSDLDVLSQVTATNSVKDICGYVEDMLKRPLSNDELHALTIKARFWFLMARRKEHHFGVRDSDLVELGNLQGHLAWALDEISGGDYSKTPKHECEFTTNPEKGHCNFCWGFWAAVGAAFPNKFATDINDD